MSKEKTPIQNLIYEVRGSKVLMDSDLAELYEVELKRLNQAVKRNFERFPDDFMFQLTNEEWEYLRLQIATSSQENLRSQFVTSSQENMKPQYVISRNDNLRSQNATSSGKHGGRRYLPYVFTEQGVAMLSSVLNSSRAIEVNINIMRAFVKLRQFTMLQSGTSEQIAELRHLLMLYMDNNDKRVNDIIIALNNLIQQPPKTRKIGFNAD